MTFANNDEFITTIATVCCVFHRKHSLRHFESAWVVRSRADMSKRQQYHRKSTSRPAEQAVANGCVTAKYTNNCYLIARLRSKHRWHERQQTSHQSVWASRKMFRQRDIKFHRMNKMFSWCEQRIDGFREVLIVGSSWFSSRVLIFLNILMHWWDPQLDW